MTTPTTEDIKRTYVKAMRNTSAWTEGERKAQKDFDSWLAEHDREVARKTMLDWIEMQVETTGKLGDAEDYEEVMRWDSAVRYWVDLQYGDNK